MKKIFSLIASSLVAMTMSAQNVFFCDAEGNVIENGTTLVMNEYDEEMGQVTLTNLGVKNTAGIDITATVSVTPESVPNGNFSCCMGGSCFVINEGTTKEYSLKVKAGSIEIITFTEWMTDEPGTCIVTFTTGEQKVTVNFVYSDPAGINEVKVEDANAPVYNIAGQRVGANANGLLIKNGKKVIVK